MRLHTISRRKFIESSGVAISSIAIGPSAFHFIRNQDNNQVLHIGIIGVGSRGKGLLNLLKDIENVQITAICDLRDDHLIQAKKMLSAEVKTFKKYDDFMQYEKLDAVVIATPLYLHYPMAISAMKHGKHVYLEKAISYDIPQAIDLVKQVEKSNLIFQVGHQYRYFGLYKRIKEIIDKGWIGKVLHYECQYHRNSNWKFPVPAGMEERFVNWRMYKESSGGLMTELCGHPID
ncbi:MAG: Gfo/Idh/MocA family protein, partial [Sphingobacterium sp.]